MDEEESSEGEEDTADSYGVSDDAVSAEDDTADDEKVKKDESDD